MNAKTDSVRKDAAKDVPSGYKKTTWTSSAGAAYTNGPFTIVRGRAPGSSWTLYRTPGNNKTLTVKGGFATAADAAAYSSQAPSVADLQRAYHKSMIAHYRNPNSPFGTSEREAQNHEALLAAVKDDASSVVYSIGGVKTGPGSEADAEDARAESKRVSGFAAQVLDEMPKGKAMDPAALSNSIGYGSAPDAVADVRKALDVLVSKGLVKKSGTKYRKDSNMTNPFLAKARLDGAFYERKDASPKMPPQWAKDAQEMGSSGKGASAVNAEFRKRAEAAGMSPDDVRTVVEAMLVEWRKGRNARSV